MSLQPADFLIHVDFAESYTNSQQEAIQSAYCGQHQLTTRCNTVRILWSTPNHNKMQYSPHTLVNTNSQQDAIQSAYFGQHQVTTRCNTVRILWSTPTHNKMQYSPHALVNLNSQQDAIQSAYFGQHQLATRLQYSPHTLIKIYFRFSQYVVTPKKMEFLLMIT